MVTVTKATPTAPSPLELLLELIRRARAAEEPAVLRFLAVNDTHLLTPFQQAALWIDGEGVQALSGLTEVDANAPYVQWLSAVCAHLQDEPPRPIGASDLPAALAPGWSEWLPEHAIWLPFRNHAAELRGGLVLARELPWRDIDGRLLVEWIQTWFCAYRALHQPSLLRRVRRACSRLPGLVRRRPFWCAAAAAAVLLCPVHISVLAPGELVPANPIAVRAPVDGVIKTFFVRSNQPVRAGEPLFAYDDTALQSRLQLATEALRTAEAEQRQYDQQAFSDARARSALSAARGAVEERRVEVAYWREQLERNQVLAPQAGVAFIDDPTEWIGRSVTAGQRILRLAEPGDREIEAWLPIGDAIELADGAETRLYLAASPLQPVTGKLRYVAYEALRRPDGSFAYRVRATLISATAHRVGLKGTVRLSGRRVPLVYWMLRRPLAAAREFFGR